MDNIEDALTNLAGHLPFGGAPATEETTASNLSAAADIVSQDVVTSRNVFEVVSVTSTVSPPLTSTEAVDPVSTNRSLKTIFPLKKMCDHKVLNELEAGRLVGRLQIVTHSFPFQV